MFMRAVVCLWITLGITLSPKAKLRRKEIEMQEGRVGSAKPIPGYDASVVSKEPRVGKIIARKRGAITKIAALIIILIISCGILTSPWVSPISSIRDTDGDGVVDSFDKDWLNSSTWNEAYAKLTVSITNLDMDHNISFLLYLDGVGKGSWDIPPLKTSLIFLPVSWQYGDNSTKTFTINILYSSLVPIDRNSPPVDSRTIVVHPNDSIAVPSYY